MNSLTTSCFIELNARYAKIRDIPPSHQEAIAWTVKNNGDTMSWTAKDYAPELELSITSGNTPELVMNGSSIGPWFSKDCVHHSRVFVDTTYLVVGLEGYDKTVDLTIPRGVYTALAIAQMITKGFNAIDGNRIFDREENGGLIVLAHLGNEHPSMIVISNDNPFIPVSPGITRRIDFTFYRK